MKFKFRDYSTLMICCDFCSIWYHVKCVGVKKGEVTKIEKYACKPCCEKGHETVYSTNGRPKKPRKRAESNENKKFGENKQTKVKKEPQSGTEENVKRAKNTFPSRSSSLLNSASTKIKIENGEEEAKINTRMPQIKSEPPFQDAEPLKANDIASCSRSAISESSPPLQLVPASILKQQQLQEENPELRCKNCIGCFRDKDCGKCVVCLQTQGRGKICMQRVCVQVEELFLQIAGEKLTAGVSNKASDLSSSEGEVQVRRKGRKPKHLAAVKQEPKECSGSAEKARKHRHGAVSLKSEEEEEAAQLNKFYCTLMRNKLKNKRVCNQDETQCNGPGCTKSVRPGSKYCSETCGLALAQLRLKTILPQRLNDFFSQVPSSQINDRRKLHDLEGKISLIKQKLKQLEEWKENVDNFLEAIKNAQPSDEQTRNDDEGLMIGCPVCAGEFPMRESTKHIQSCYARSERQTTYGTDYPIPNNQYNLYCDVYNKINKTYCKRLRYACSEHYKDEHELKICGCPLSWYKNGSSIDFCELFLSSDAMISDGGYCQERRKNCRAHQNWIQTAFSSIDNERMNLLNQLEEICEQHGFITKKLLDSGDVLTLLCNQTRRLETNGGEEEESCAN